ncbi:MAG TPA: SDR family NAD(P)-dependent oxidoreductase [Acidimicrobiales bacterium]|nr:SDR family NAD(P)-dependent oxidoreductase [Acidimicrobiales bacterium]
MTQPLALVTGAATGIGAAVATTIAERGHYVVVTDVDVEGATKVATEVGGEALRLDVTDAAMVSRIVDLVVTKHQRLDVVVANAGISKMQRFVDVTPEDLGRTLNVNLAGVFYCGQAAARAMISLGKGGSIVNTASMAAKQGGVPFLADYVASKFGVLGLTQAMAYELAPHGIRVNCVCPGYVATSMQERELAWEAALRGMAPDSVRQLYIEDTPLGRVELTADVARAVAFLASADAAFITGEALSVNGGAYMD